MDKKILEHAEKSWTSKEGFKCAIVKQPMGHRCGYVAVNNSHITRKIANYDDVPVDVHGGLTYGGFGVWGFDCNHLDDTDEYWTLSRVEEETNKLSENLAKLTWSDIIKAKLEYMPKWFTERVEYKQKKIKRSEKN